MGAGKLQPLVQAVDSIELCYDGDGVMSAVQVYSIFIYIYIYYKYNAIINILQI